MSKKLTLRLDEDAIERAKRYAARRDTSVSKLVERFFDQLDDDTDGDAGDDIEDSELVASLRGIIEDADVEESDYYDYLWEKHQ
ncbi:MAG: DUF6364 family protein [Bradymonadaceae bacterium]